MSDSFLDHLPSYERRKLKARMSPEAYERLREKVKGPEDLEKELRRGEQMAELSFELQTDEKLREHLKTSVEKDFAEKGIDAVVAHPPSNEAKAALEKGKFALAVSAHPHTHEDHLVAVPEGNVREAIPIKLSFSDRYVGQYVKNASPKMQHRKAA